VSASHLTVVSNASLAPLAADPIAQRIRDLRDEARALAREQVERLHQALIETARLAAEIAGGGDAFGVGAREFARHTAEDAGHQAAMLAGIVDRERN
jgi:heme exporter protein D